MKVYTGATEIFEVELGIIIEFTISKRKTGMRLELYRIGDNIILEHWHTEFTDEKPMLSWEYKIVDNRILSPLKGY